MCKKVVTVDFETNNSNEAIENNSTHVWLWDICELYTYEHKTGKDINDILKDRQRVG